MHNSCSAINVVRQAMHEKHQQEVLVAARKAAAPAHYQIDVSLRGIESNSALRNICQVADRNWWLVGLQELGQGMQQ